MIVRKVRVTFRRRAVLFLILGLCVPAVSMTSVTKSMGGETRTLTLPGGVELEMVRIPAGSFRMGSPKSERGRYSDEGPAHTVNINYDFYMGKHEVTQAQWKAVMKTNPARRYGVGDNYPVSHVSWDDCQAFIGKLKQLGLPGTFRLPSEAEWEYACRARSQTRFYFGDSLRGSDTCNDCAAGKLVGKRSAYMWYCGSKDSPDNPDFGTIEVGQLLPNAFSLHDMHGNVWEWCLDQYHGSYVGAPTDGSAWQTWAGAARVLRGGGWGYHANNCRSAVRCGYTASRPYTFHGFRVVWFPYEKYSDKWYASWMAETIGDNMISYQSEIGAWPKNMPMEAHGYQGEKFTKNWGTTIDNGATYSQMNFLARVYHATGKKRFKESFIRGLDYLLEAQYETGGWPQRYPLCGDYGDHITFNDDAMVGVLSILRDVAEKKPEFAFVDGKRRKKVKTAVRKGIECILKCQIIVDGKRTAWCQQHDEKTLEPRPARAYEPIAITGRESVRVVKFLMSIDNPSPEVIEAVQDAIAWFECNKITGIRVVHKDGDRIVVEDPNAPPMWARFYQIVSSQPIFAGMDTKVKYKLAEIDKLKRTSYSYYGHYATELLAKDYPAWQKKWTPEKNVLKNSTLKNREEQ